MSRGPVAGYIAPTTHFAAETNKRLSELPAFIDQVCSYKHWEKPPPLKSYTVYEVSQQSNSPRGDTVVGTTCIPLVIRDFLQNLGQMEEDPLAGTGAQFGYLEIDASVFPDGSQSEVRGGIEDALDEALSAEASGRTLGGALGTGASYIDLLLLDGDDSWRIVRETLEGLQLNGRTRCESFV